MSTTDYLLTRPYYPDVHSVHSVRSTVGVNGEGVETLPPESGVVRILGSASDNRPFLSRVYDTGADWNIRRGGSPGFPPTP